MCRLVGVCADITNMLLGANVTAPAFQTMVSVFDDAVLVHKIIIMYYVLLAIDIPIVTYSVVILPIKP